MKDELPQTSDGPRSFSVFLTQVDDGALHAEASREMHKLTSALRDHAMRFARDAKGSITLTLSLEVDEKGVADVVGSLAVKAPKAPRSKSQFFVTQGGNLTLENPRQQRLALGVVPAPEVRELPAELREPARSV